MAVSTPTPTGTPTTKPVSSTGRRVGYAIAAAINVVLLYLVNVRPGWEVLPFLTEDTTAVLGLVNLSMAAGVVVNALWVVADPPWFHALGQLTLSGITLVAAVQILTVFPFDFSSWAFDPSWLVRFVLIVTVIGTGISMLVELVRLVRALLGR